MQLSPSLSNGPPGPAVQRDRGTEAMGEGEDPTGHSGPKELILQNSCQLGTVLSLTMTSTISELRNLSLPPTAPILG